MHSKSARVNILLKNIHGLWSGSLSYGKSVGISLPWKKNILCGSGWGFIFLPSSLVASLYLLHAIFPHSCVRYVEDTLSDPILQSRHRLLVAQCLIHFREVRFETAHAPTGYFTKVYFRTRNTNLLVLHCKKYTIFKNLFCHLVLLRF